LTLEIILNWDSSLLSWKTKYWQLIRADFHRISIRLAVDEKIGRNGNWDLLRLRTVRSRNPGYRSPELFDPMHRVSFADTPGLLILPKRVFVVPNPLAILE
jgi:hypothetical protein